MGFFKGISSVIESPRVEIVKVEVPFPVFNEVVKEVRIEVPVIVTKEVVREIRVEVPVIQERVQVVEKEIIKEVVKEIRVEIQGNRFQKAWMALLGKI